MSKRKVFLKDLNVIATEIDYMLTTNDTDNFLSIMSLENLKALRETQLKTENYESMEIIDKHIKLKEDKLNDTKDI